MRLNEKLKSLRASKNLTQENLATKLGVTRQTISKWEKGISVPDADVLSQIADIFEVSVAELLGSEEKEEIKGDHVAQLLATMNEEMAAKNKHRKTMIRNSYRASCIASVERRITAYISCILGLGYELIKKFKKTIDIYGNGW